jgi:crotonobetainyl-CoA:carnitine CoA-transferase CaiB-like acyl-CoA transferase
MSLAFSNIFKGLKVVELAQVLAGPSVGMFFAELGAHVLKIENPATGDMTRHWKHAAESHNHPVSAYFASVNWGKTFLKLDLTISENFERLLDELKDADILLVNFKSGDAEKFSLRYADLKDKFPRLIYGSIIGFETNNPRMAFDLILQAESGFMRMNGTLQSGPLKMPVALIDVLAAHHLKEAILLALIQRQTSGAGCAVEVSLLDAAVASLVNQAANYLMVGQIPSLQGSLHPNIAPYGETFTCADEGQIVIAAATNQQFFNLCRLLNQEAWATDPLFLDNQQRVKNRILLQKRLIPIFLAEKSEEICTKLNKNGIPAGCIRTLDQVLKDAEDRNMVFHGLMEGKPVHVVRSFIAKTVL